MRRYMHYVMVRSRRQTLLSRAAELFKVYLDVFMVIRTQELVRKILATFEKYYCWESSFFGGGVGGSCMRLLSYLPETHSGKSDIYSL